MKSKKAIYYLLPVVALVWGVIFYRIFTNMHSDVSISTNSSDRVHELADDGSMKADTFSIKADYRDPFLGNILITDKKDNIEDIHDEPPVYVQPLNWPQVSFGGRVKNKLSGKDYALIKVSGKEYIVRPGDMAEGLEILKMYKDSVLIKYKTEKKTVKK